MSNPDTLAIEAQIAELYRPAVMKAADFIDRYSFCSISGPFRSGKTTTLIPALESHFSEAGLTVVNIPNPILDSSIEASIGYGVEQAEKGLVIIDKAANASVKNHEQDVLRYFQRLGYAAAIPVVTYPYGNINTKTDIVNRWRPASVAEVSHISLEPPYLSKELTRAYLNAYGASKEVADYFMTLPHYLAVIALVREMDGPTLHELPKALTDLDDNLTRCRGAIPSIELNSAQLQVHIAKEEYSS